MAAGRDGVPPSRLRTDEEAETTGEMSAGHSGEGLPQNEEPLKHDEIRGISTGVVDQVNERGEQQEDRGADDDVVEEEEEGECGFCLFMKGGPCKDEFIAWENCVEAAESNKENIVDACFEVTGLLRKCMEAHIDYYEPILRAEKAMEEEATREASEEEQEPITRDIAEPAKASGAQQGK